eukprot:g29454.t1
MKGTKPPLGPESGGTFLAAFEYSDKLNQQVLSLEADNVELQDGKKLLEAENQALKGKIAELQLQCEKLRDTSIHTHQDKEAAILQAREALQSKQAEVMLARKAEEDVKQQVEAISEENLRLRHRLAELDQRNSEIWAEVEHWRHAEKAATAHHPRLEEAMKRESALADTLRQRIADLEEQVAKALHAQAAAEADCAGAKSQLASSRSEISKLADAAARLAAEKSHAEQMASLAHAEKEEAHRKHHVLEKEHLPKLMAQHQAAAGNVGDLRHRLAQLEGENTLLKGKVSEAEVLIRGLRAECSKLPGRHARASSSTHEAPTSDLQRSISAVHPSPSEGYPCSLTPMAPSAQGSGPKFQETAESRTSQAMFTLSGGLRSSVLGYVQNVPHAAAQARPEESKPEMSLPDWCAEAQHFLAGDGDAWP